MKSLLSPLWNAVAPLGIPLAWRQLTRDRKRFATAIVGVTFGVVLMLYQVGLYTAANRMVVFPHNALKGEIVITSRNYEYFYSNRPFSKRVLYQVQAFPEVASVAPLGVDFLKWKNTETGVDKMIGILSINPSQNPFILPDVARQAGLLTNGENVLFDAKSAKTDFGNIGEAFRNQGEVITEIEHSKVRVKGLFSMGQSLAVTGHVIVSDEGMGRIHPNRSANMINLGMVSLRPGVDPAELRGRIAALLPKDVRVLTAGEFRREEQAFWISRTAIGFICMAGMLVGMLVGGIVVYQILYTDVTDHLREYATLKAMGITDRFLFGIVLTEALILLAAVALPSTILTGALFYVTRNGSGMPTELTVPELAAVFALAALMCIMAGFLATRKLKTADPADIF
jgi:putative ABC transport system permease protein